MEIKSAKRYSVDYMGFLLSALIAIAYALVKSLVLSPSGRSIQEIIISSILVFLVSYVIREGMLQSGLQKGFNSSVWQATAEEHNKVIERVQARIGCLYDFMDFDYARRLKRVRMGKLLGIEYENVFDEKGNIKEYSVPLPSLEGKNEKQIKALMKKYRHDCQKVATARKVQVPQYTSEQVLGRDNNNGVLFNHSTHKFFITSSITGLIVSTAFLFIFSLVEPKGFDWVSLIMSFGVILMSYCSAMLGYMNAYVFITKTLRDDVLDKIRMLNEFDIWAAEPIKAEPPITEPPAMEVPDLPIQEQETATIQT
jgi:hypothetical protein